MKRAQIICIDNKFYVGILSRPVFYQWVKCNAYHNFWKIKMASICINMTLLFQYITALKSIMSTAVCLCMIYWNNAKLSVRVYYVSALHPWWVFLMEETQL